MPPWLGGCVVFLLLAVMPLGGCVPFGLFVWFVRRVLGLCCFVRLLSVLRARIFRFFLRLHLRPSLFPLFLGAGLR